MMMIGLGLALLLGAAGQGTVVAPAPPVWTLASAAPWSGPCPGRASQHCQGHVFYFQKSGTAANPPTVQQCFVIWERGQPLGLKPCKTITF
jgi:hypothetical protein